VNSHGPAYDVSIVTSGHDVADARLHRLVGAFVRAGLSVEVRGLGDVTAGPEGAASVVTKDRGGMVARGLRAVSSPWQARGRVLVLLDPDTIPSAVVAKLRGRALVVDVHEDYAALLSDRQWAYGVAGRLARGLVSMSTRLARRADLTVVADAHVPPLHARDRVVVRNEPDHTYLPPLSKPDETPRALYVGDVRATRGLFTMLDAVAAAPHWGLDIVGPVSSIDEPRALARAGEADLAGRVRWHGRLAPAQSWALASGAWIGFALLDDTAAFHDAVPSKLYEYLACGLPAVVTDLPRQAALVRESGAGVVVADAVGAAGALNDYANDPELFAAHRKLAVSWSREHAEDSSAYDELAARVAVLARRPR